MSYLPIFFRFIAVDKERDNAESPSSFRTYDIVKLAEGYHSIPPSFPTFSAKGWDCTMTLAT